MSTIQLACYAVIAFAGIGAGYQKISEIIDDQIYPPIGQIVKVGAQRFHMIMQGQEDDDAPIVVLEYGLGSDSTIWSDIQPKIAKFARVYSYDRAGLGWSDADGQPATAEHVVKNLHGLLYKADGAGQQYILVGHSFGGLIAQLYAMQYPQQVAGMVLIDPAHEDMLDEIPQEMLQAWKSQEYKLWQAQAILAPLGLYRFQYQASLRKKLLEIHHPEKTVNARVANMCKSNYLPTYYSEVQNMRRSFEQLKQANPNFGDIPLTVIVAGNLHDVSAYGFSKMNAFDATVTQDFAQMCIDHKNKQAARSTQGELVVAHKSGHRIPFDEPDLVVDKVRHIVEKVRGDISKN